MPLTKEQIQLRTAKAQETKARKKAAVKAREAARIAKVQAEYAHIIHKPLKTIQEPLPVISVKAKVPKSNVPKGRLEALARGRQTRLERLAASRQQKQTRAAITKTLKQIERAAKKVSRAQKQKVSRKKVGEDFTFKEMLEGKLPDQYPYYMQTHSTPRPPAKLMRSDRDVAEYLSPYETTDTRAYPADNIASDDEAEAIIQGPDYAYVDDRSAQYEHKPEPSGPRYVTSADINGEPSRGVGSGGSSAGGSGGGCGGAAYSVAENCLLNILRLMDHKVDKVYKKFPHLRPNGTGAPIYIYHEQLSEVSRLLRINITVYTALGWRIGVPWHEFKYNTTRKIHIIIENEHAYLARKQFTIDHVEYCTLPDIRQVEGLVVDHEYYAPGSVPQYIQDKHPGEKLIPKYYTVLLHNKYIMYKDYKVSGISNNITDDELAKYYYTFNDSQYLFKRFKKQYDLRPVNQKDVAHILKAAEHFIGREIFKPLTKAVRVLDHNKSFVSYKTCKYYMGFPGNELAATELPAPSEEEVYESPYDITFVAIKSIEGMPWYVSRVLKYTSGPIIVIYPMYLYLRTVCKHIEVDYCMESKVKDIDINEFTDRAGITESEKKLFRNSLIGRCIGGGLKSTKKITIQCGNDREKEQILHECMTYDKRVTIHPSNALDVKYENDKITGLYQFHSYILGYAAIQLMMKMDEVVNNGGDLAGFNVDCILYYGDYDASKDVSKIGGWKYESIHGKTALQRWKISKQEPFPERTIPRPDFMDGFRFTRNTVICGPPGIGKSHGMKTKPLFDMIITTPTRNLREQHKAGEHGFENTVTEAKYTQFSRSTDQWRSLLKANKIPRHHYTHIIDEFTMYNQNQLNTIFERQGKGITILIGDFEQICNSIDGKAVTKEFCEENGFDIVEMHRTTNGIARHTYAEGVILDSLRGKTHEEQVALIRPHVSSVDNIYDNIPNMIRGPCGDCVNKDPSERHCECNEEESLDIYISDTHVKLHEVNIAARKHCIAHKMTFPVNDGKGNIIRVPANDPLIWWDRLCMRDTMPDEFRYEPAFARTADSLQGATIDASKIYVNVNMKREKVFYTAITRTRPFFDRVVLVEKKEIPDKEEVDEFAEYDDVDTPPVAPTWPVGCPTPTETALQLFPDPSTPVDIDPDILELLGDIPDDIPAPAQPTSVCEPIRYAKLDDVPDNGMFTIHTEYPHRHFLQFDCWETFREWASAQPADQRCYHEVVHNDTRKIVVDIDGKGIPRGEWLVYSRLFTKAFIETFHEVFGIILMDQDLVPIDSSGYSQTTVADKFSLQIRTAQHITNAASCKHFALKYADKLGPNGQYVDTGVYKTIQNFRCVGSTKLGDSRHSRIVGNIPTKYSLVNTYDCHATIIEPIVESVEKTDQVIIGDEFAQRIVDASAQYTKGMQYKLKGGMHTFIRTQSSHCSICNREHENDNMFVNCDKNGRVMLKCWRDILDNVRGSKGKNSILLFTIDPPKAPEPTPATPVVITPTPEPVVIPPPVVTEPLPLQFSEGPLLDHPKKMHRAWTVAARRKVLNMKYDFITRAYPKMSLDDKLETFSEYGCWAACEKAMSGVVKYIKAKNMYPGAIKKYMNQRFAWWRARINRENVCSTTSAPINVSVYKDLYTLANKHLRAGKCELALMYSSVTLFELMYSIQAELYELDPTNLTSIEEAKAFWARIKVSSVPTIDDECIDLMI